MKSLGGKEGKKIISKTRERKSDILKNINGAINLWAVDAVKMGQKVAATLHFIFSI